jgi:hypothetical protein
MRLWIHGAWKRSSVALYPIFKQISSPQILDADKEWKIITHLVVLVIDLHIHYSLSSEI